MDGGAAIQCVSSCDDCGFLRVREWTRIAAMLVIWCWAVSARSGESLAVVEIAPGVFVHQGAHIAVDRPGRGDSANIGFIIGRGSVAVIDTGGSIAMGRALLAAIRERTARPIGFVINTHVHFDHVLGNAAFIDEAPRFVAHANFAAALFANRVFFKQEFARELAGAEIIPAGSPDLPVDDTLDLDLGDRILKITAHPRAHTDQDLSIYDPATRTLWAADLLFVERIPALDASILGWLAVLDDLASLPAKRAVPGHGPVSVPWPAAVAGERRYLRTLVTEIRALIKHGGFLEDALDTVAQDERRHWRLFAAHHRRNIIRAFKELEWE